MTTRPLVLVLAFVLLAGSSALAGYRYQRDAARWEPDAAIYLRMALQDRGLDRAAAREQADRFMRTTSEATNPGSRGFYGARPPRFYAEQFDLFRSRPLYPALGALLYPRLGAHGLQAISAAAYALAVPLLFLILLLVAPAWIAFLGAVVFALAPPVLNLASYAMTDELALLFWIAALGAMLLVRRGAGPLAPGAVLGAAMALAFTRPAAYLPVGAALGWLVTVRHDPRPRAAALRLVALTGAVAVAFFVFNGIVHGPGLVEQLRWQYGSQRAIGAAPANPVAWYGLALARSAFGPLVRNVVQNGALVALALLVCGLTGRGGKDRGLLAGAAAVALLALFANPLELVRTVVLPVTPVALILAADRFAALVASRRSWPSPRAGRSRTRSGSAPSRRS